MRNFVRFMIALSLSAVAGLAAAANQTPIRIGWTAWADAEISAKLAKKVIEEQTHRPVELVMAEIAIQFQGLMNRSVDVIPMVWLPGTHKAYWDKYGKDLEDLGVIYEGKIGWAVPDFIPESELSTVEDLNKPGMAAKFDGTILAASPGTGQYGLAVKAVEDYGLKGYKVMPSSETGMLSQFSRRYDRKEWAIVNAWNPHWMFSKWKLRYLKEPKGIFGGTEQIHMVGRPGLREDEPQIANFLAHFTIPLSDLETMQMEAQGSTAEKVVDAYYAEHRDRFAAMFNGPSTAAAKP